MSELLEATIEWLPIASLKLLENNPRTVSQADFDNLCESIAEDSEFFVERPCLVNRLAGELIVYAGNTKLKAAKQLGWEKVPCIVSEISRALMEERALKDNDHAGKWNLDIMQKWDKNLVKKALPHLSLPEQFTTQLAQTQASFTEQLKAQNSPSRYEAELLEEDDEEASLAHDPAPKPPMFQPKIGRNDEQYSSFDVLMLAEDRQYLINLLNDIKNRYQIPTMESALIKLCEFYPHKPH